MLEYKLEKDLTKGFLKKNILLRSFLEMTEKTYFTQN